MIIWYLFSLSLSALSADYCHNRPTDDNFNVLISTRIEEIMPIILFNVCFTYEFCDKCFLTFVTILFLCVYFYGNCTPVCATSGEY